jgi:hypothetical protein
MSEEDISLNEASAKPIWHVMDSTTLLKMLHRVADGEDPEMVYLEEYANAKHNEKE